MELNEMDEFVMEAYTNVKLYKKHTKALAWHTHLIRNFVQVHQVLLYKSRLKLFSGKLKFRWSDPFVVIQAFPHGVVKIKDEKIGTQFNVNRQRLKKYFRENLIGYISTIV